MNGARSERPESRETTLITPRLIHKTLVRGIERLNTADTRRIQTRNCIKCGRAHFHRQGNLHKEEQGRSGGTPFCKGGQGTSIRPTYVGTREGCLHRLARTPPPPPSLQIRQGAGHAGLPTHFLTI